jgi:hypothetical protein
VAQQHENIIIHVKVQHGAAVKQLGEVAAAIKAVKASCEDLHDCFDDIDFDRLGNAASGAARDITDLGDATDDSSKKSEKAVKRFDFFWKKSFLTQFKSHNKLKEAIAGVRAAFGKFLKLAKWLIIEFVAMSAALGAVALSVYVAQGAVKLWNFSLNALGAAAGVAVGGLAAVLSAMRELQAVRLSPLFDNAKGVRSSESMMNLLLGDDRLGMFSDGTLVGAMESARRSGIAINQQFRNMVALLGNFALGGTGDPNQNLGHLTQAFALLNEQGKVTKDVFELLQKGSPALADAVGEIASKGKVIDPVKLNKVAADAADAGSVSSKAFIDAIQKGQLKTLAPYAGLLDKVNQTIVGRFKKQLRLSKEVLIQVGRPLRDIINPKNNNPIDIFGQRIRVMFYQLGPVLNREFGRIFQKLFNGRNMGVMDSMMNRLTARILKGLPMIIGWGEGLMNVIGKIRRFFQDVYPWFSRMKEGWDELYDTFWRPIGVEVFETLRFAVEDFSTTMSSMDNKGWQDAIAGLGKGLRNIIKVFNDLKEKLAPITEGLFKFIGVILKNDLAAKLLVWGPVLMMFGKLQFGLVKLGSVWVKVMAEIALGTKGAKKSADDFNRSAEAMALRQRLLRAGGFFGQLGGFMLGGGVGGGKFGKWLGGKVAGAGARMAGMGAEGSDLSGFQTVSKVSGMLNGLALPASMIGMAIQGSADRKDTTAQALGGLLSGAGMGAMAGSMIPIPGAAGVGAVIGGGFGLYSAFRDSAKAAGEERKARRVKNASSLLAGVDVNSVESIASTYDSLTRQRAELENMRALAQAASGSSGTLYDNMLASERMGIVERTVPEELRRVYSDGSVSRTVDAKKVEEVIGGLDEAISDLAPRTAVATDNLDVFSNFLGKSAKDMDDWTRSTGFRIDQWGVGIQTVFEKVYNYTEDHLANLAIAAERLGAVMEPADWIPEEQAAEATLAGTETLKRIAATRSFGSEAEMKTTAFELLRAQKEYLIGAFANNEFQGMDAAEIMNQLTQGKGLVTNALKNTPAEFQAFYGQKYDERLLAIGQALTNPKRAMEFFPSIAEEARNLLPEYSDPALMDAIKNKDKTAIAAAGKKLVDDARDGGSGVLANASPELRNFLLNFDNAKGYEGLGKLLTNTLNDPNNTKNIHETIKTAHEEGGVAIAAKIQTAIETAKLNLTELKLKVQKDNKGNLKVSLVPKDTRSPRGVGASRWAMTAAQHALLDRSVPGRRTITSGVRRDQLGSLGSDHLYGRAYDLVGDNLVGYATRVRSAGGFAEFHGGLADRHLHVVPQVGPIGDTAVPASVGMRSSGGVVTQTVSFNITAGPNASAEEIAQAVMARLARAERNARERM